MDLLFKESLLEYLRSPLDRSLYTGPCSDDIFGNMTLRDRVDFAYNIVPLFDDVVWNSSLIVAGFYQGRIINKVFDAFSEYEDFSADEFRVLMDGSFTPIVCNLFRNEKLPLDFWLDKKYINTSYKSYIISGNTYIGNHPYTGSSSVTEAGQVQLPRVVKILRDKMRKDVPEVDSLSDEMILSVAGVKLGMDE